jgi:hypothetical protein
LLAQRFKESVLQKRIAHQLWMSPSKLTTTRWIKVSITRPFSQRVMSQWPSCTPILPRGWRTRGSRNTLPCLWLEPTIQRPVGARLEIARPKRVLTRT